MKPPCEGQLAAPRGRCACTVGAIIGGLLGKVLGLSAYVEEEKVVSQKKPEMYKNCEQNSFL